MGLGWLAWGWLGSGRCFGLLFRRRGDAMAGQAPALSSRRGEGGIKITIKITIRRKIGNWGMGGLGTEIVDLAADEGGHAKELTDVKGFWASLGQFVFDSGQMTGQAAQLLFMRGEDSLVEGFGFESLKFLDLVVAFAVPVNETAFGDADVGGDAGKAPALGAEFDELVLCFFSEHMEHMVM